MRSKRRPSTRFAWVAAASVWLVACGGDASLPLQNRIVCAHPYDDSVARRAENDALGLGVLQEVEAAVPFDAEQPSTATSALAVQFKRAPGFHVKQFGLELEANDAESEIYYTLDGSIPQADAAVEPDCAPPPGDFGSRTYRYTRPIDLSWWLSRPNQLSLVDTGSVVDDTSTDRRRKWMPVSASVGKAAVVRAQAVRGTHVSSVTSGTFFVDARGRQRYSLPVVSLAAEPAQLFGEDEGIYVVGKNPEAPNFAQRGSAWERPAYFEVFDELGQRPVAQQVGIRIHGNFTRGFAQKSLRLYARKEYGRSRLEHQFFATRETSEFKRLILRNGGNDWGASLFRDAAIQKLVQHLPLETQHAQPSVVFINGEYWGIHLFRDRLDEFHLEIQYGIPREEIAILERDALVKAGSEADVADYHAFLDQLDSGSLNDADSIDRYFALPELLDYTILQAYAGNTDWPHNNIGYFRYSGPQPSEQRGPRDGRWRMFVFDLDRTFGRNDSLNVDMIAALFGDKQGHWSRRLFHGFIKVEAIRHEFIQRMAMRLATTFDPDRVSGTLDEFQASLEPEMPEHIERWGRPESMDAFYSEVETSHNFARQRPKTVRKQMVSFFEGLGPAKVRVHNIDPTNPPTLHGVKLSAQTPGVAIHDGVWEAPVFAGVPLVLQSGGKDLREATVDGGTVAQVSADRLALMLEPETLVSVHLP